MKNIILQWITAKVVSNLEKELFKRFIDEYNDLDTQDYSSLLELIRRIVKDLLGKSRSGILL
ncbi:MAG: hypothetical protein ACXADW_22145, partial [Candidatus Hodarchaeales archaeon]